VHALASGNALKSLMVVGHQRMVLFQMEG